MSTPIEVVRILPFGRFGKIRQIINAVRIARVTWLGWPSAQNGVYLDEVNVATFVLPWTLDGLSFIPFPPPPTALSDTFRYRVAFGCQLSGFDEKQKLATISAINAPMVHNRWDDGRKSQTMYCISTSDPATYSRLGRSTRGTILPRRLHWRRLSWFSVDLCAVACHS